MKTFLKWTVVVAGVGTGVAFAIRAIQEGRSKLRNALADAEAVAAQTRRTLQQTETALDHARTAI